MLTYWNDKPKFTLRTVFELAGHLHELRKHWFKMSVLLWIFVTLVSLEPYFYKWLIEAIQEDRGIEMVIVIIVIWGITSIGAIVGRYIYAMNLLNHIQEDWKNFLLKTMRKMQSLPIEYHHNIQAGEKQKIIDRASESVWSVGDNLILMVFPQLIIFVILLVWGLFISPIFTFLSLIFLPFWIWGVTYLGKQAHKNQSTVNPLWDKVFDRLNDWLVNLPVIRVFARKERELDEMSQRLDRAATGQHEVRKDWAKFNAFGRFFTLIAKLVTIASGGILFYTGKTDLATFFFFIAFTDRIYSPIMEIFSVVQATTRDASYYHKAQELFKMSNEIDAGKKVLEKVSSSISFQNLSFSYPSNDREVLHDIDFEIQKWQRIALVGHTGSGKSTIIQLLMRFYEPSAGKIMIDGTNVFDFTLESYRQKFAAVFQDTTLFNETIRHNLEYVRDNISQKDLEKACKQANIFDFINSLPDKWETEVGERGLKLSGGEKQRIAIARVMLANPDILILDEATSALDTKTERLVQEAFDRLMEWRTSIIIAHRLSTIMNADIIYLLDKWRIIGSGTHTELYEKSEEYKEMVDLQHDGFVGVNDEENQST